ncbi:PREDICTED: putative odorant-binding protein A10, partial [Diuraphis noxia]|uniref:putative odorant-binding protein A10 n=1 Tax=Diuraphis noxia TaxID=143948 RepID=UPI00076396DB
TKTIFTFVSACFYPYKLALLQVICHQLIFYFFYFTGVIPVIANNGCNGCTERQMTTIKKSLNFLRTKKPVEWARLVKIYDPSGTKLNKFLDA